VLTQYNRRFLQMKESSLFVTMVFGLLDLQSLRTALVHAGHPPALYCPAGGQAFHPVGVAGVPIGVLEEPGYEASLLALEPGSRLALYSDGVTDCSDAAGTAFGPERLRGLLHAHRAVPLAEAGALLYAALRGWRAVPAFEDDMTFLALEVH
jgi:sigma-B regulation protein RsbU (phosphoserine phosphatase)